MTKKRASFIVSIFTLFLLFLTIFFRRSAYNESQQFDAFTKQLFTREVAGNSISLHYTLKDPSSYHIKEKEPTLGSFQTDPVLSCAALENALYALHTFSRNSLTASQKRTYDVLEDYYTKSLSLAPFSFYEEPLAPYTGVQAQLPLLLAEYPFYKEEDILSYFSLLSKVPSYFQSLCDLEKTRQKNGISMGISSIDSLLSECQSLSLAKQDHYLFSSFKNRLDALALSEDQKKSYIQKNKEAVNAYVIPAYEALIHHLQALRKEVTSPDSTGLCYLENGKKYYQLFVSFETGSSRSIKKLKDLIQQQISEDLSSIQSLLHQSGVPLNSDRLSSQGNLLADANPSAILTSLQQKIKSDFPSCPEVSLAVKYVPDAMQAYTSPAFYMVPAIDSFHHNVIYVNPKHLNNDISLYTTLAHEGYPGHLYQNIYFLSQSPDPIRCLLNYGGYTEGWATYCEMLSYYYAPLSKPEASIFQKNNSLLLGLYARTDIGIHYDGWTQEDVAKFFAKYGFQDAEATAHIYQLIVSDPANYLKYYIGYLELLELKKLAINEWKKDFTQKRFHKVILDYGPAPFSLLKKQIKQEPVLDS